MSKEGKGNTEHMEQLKEQGCQSVKEPPTEYQGAESLTKAADQEGEIPEEAAKNERPPFISVRNVRKIYRMGSEKIVALNSVSLEIYRGEIVCFLGTSGSGKSTFLNMVAGLEKPSKGEILIGGVPIHKLNEEQVTLFRQKNIGFIFQSYQLLPMLTSLENVSLPLIFKGMGKRKREKIAKGMLKMVGLVGYDKRKPTQMSGGQQQRVGIARALVAHPKIIFADEPTGNLDTNTTREVMDLIVNMVREHNQTLIIVTHDRSIASYADRVVTIRDGDIVDLEDGEEFRRREDLIKAELAELHANREKRDRLEKEAKETELQGGAKAEENNAEITAEYIEVIAEKQEGSIQ